MHRAELQREEDSLSLSLFSLEKLMKSFGLFGVLCVLPSRNARALKFAL